jgi:transposase-like protein
MEMKECKFCKSSKLVRSGKIRGSQRYLCKECHKNQISGDGRVKYDNKIRYLALAMYLNSAGFRSIGRVLKVPFQLVHWWVKAAGELVEAEAAKRSNSPKEIAILEMDELYTYVQKKSGEQEYGLLWIGTEMRLLRIA